MASIELANLTKIFNGVRAVDDMSLQVRDNEFVALLGPSGCGKSTTMNMIAGIEQPTSGAIRFDGRDVANLPPNKRGVGFVFQNYAIFTHLSVRENLAFALKVRGVPQAEVEARVAKIAVVMRIADKLDRSSASLSVNEMQKLAIGRSAIAEPAIFLLDEPLSNVDAAFRAFMRTELKHLQHTLRQTMVYVTHDQIEAMSLADRIAVMNQGVLQQFGTPQEIYSAPINTFVANFIGSPSMNLVPSRIVSEGDDIMLQFGAAGTLKLEAGTPLFQRARCAKSKDVIFGVRPEDIELAEVSDPTLGLTLVAQFIEPIGPVTTIHFSDGEYRIKVLTEKRFRTGLGQAHRLSIPLERCHLFDRESGRALGADHEVGGRAHVHA
jgi:multiple sugar transport system ATP-binding protein